MSQICYNLQSLKIVIRNVISDGLADLISIQQNLKYLTIFNRSNGNGLAEMFSLITNPSNNLIKLHICEEFYHYEGTYYTPLSFIAKFTSLQELVLSIKFHVEDFKTLQHVTFSHLQILKFNEQCPNHESFNEFLATNGNNLKVIHLRYGNTLSNLAIAKFCPNLKSLSTIFRDDEVETLKGILNGCQELESIMVWDGGRSHLNESKLLKVIAKFSPKEFHEIKIIWNYGSRSEPFLEELEPFFISWENRILQKSLSLIIIDCQNKLKVKKENMKTIEKFKKLGVVKKFEIVK